MVKTKSQEEWGSRRGRTGTNHIERALREFEGETEEKQNRMYDEEILLLPLLIREKDFSVIKRQMKGSSWEPEVE